MKNLIIDTDAGADDLLAIRLAMCSKNISVRAILCSYGIYSVYEAQSRIENFLKLSKLKKVPPVFTGASKPFKKRFHPLREIHGDYLVDAIRKFPAFLNFRQKQNFKSIFRCEKKFHYITMGPLTNLAKIIEMGYSDQIQSVTIMGGCLSMPGNATPLSEANFFNDPQAVLKVLTSNVKNLTLVPLDLTEKIQITFDAFNKSKIKNVLKNLTTDYSHYYLKNKLWFKSNFTSKRSCYKGFSIHDCLPVGYLYLPTIFKSSKTKISLEKTIDLDGVIIPVLRGDLRIYHQNKQIKVLWKVDKKKFMEYFTETI